MRGEIKCLQTGLRLGEGPVWDAARQRLWCVDIEACKVMAIAPDGQDVRLFTTEGMVGCIVPMRNGKLLAAAGCSLVEWDEVRQTKTVHARFAFPAHLRFNDGKCDMHGNLWVGTMAADQLHPEACDGGSLMCIAHGKIIAEYKGFTIPNGLAWSDDGHTLYHIDTATQKVDTYTVGTGGALYEKRTALTFTAEQGAPDGMCADAAGNLWIALWGGGRVVCRNPHTGETLEEVVVEDANVSCCTFGGAVLKTLYITTAQDKNGKGGNLFAIETTVKGNPPFLYGGMENEAKNSGYYRRSKGHRSSNLHRNGESRL